MKVQIQMGNYCDRIGILEVERPFGIWSSVHIEREAVIFIDKTFLRVIDDGDNKN